PSRGCRAARPDGVRIGTNDLMVARSGLGCKGIGPVNSRARLAASGGRGRPGIRRGGRPARPVSGKPRDPAPDRLAVVPVRLAEPALQASLLPRPDEPVPEGAAGQ